VRARALEQGALVEAAEAAWAAVVEWASTPGMVAEKATALAGLKAVGVVAGEAAGVCSLSLPLPKKFTTYADTLVTDDDDDDDDDEDGSSAALAVPGYRYPSYPVGLSGPNASALTP